MINTVLKGDPKDSPVLDLERLRHSLRRVASTVHVIAVKCRNGDFFATTATAVVSVSFEPPTILVCLNKSGAIAQAILHEDLFSIAVLTASQQSLARACSGGLSHAEREVLFDPSDDFADAALLRGAAANLICRRIDSPSCGTHLTVFGEVIDASFRTQVDPLLYLDGRYGSFQAV